LEEKAAMSFRANGELVPSGGGDVIPLIREKLTLGRRDTCDIPLRFPNISGVHAELTFRTGYWYIRDCNSTNGIKVNGVRVLEKLLHPKDKITIGKRDYFIRYEAPADMVGKLEEVEEENVMSTSLLEKAGLAKPQPRREDDRRRTFDPADFLLKDED
jgi:pSer/pThr/pTyr-binding forkhead associated (FHA) protein